MALSDAAPLVSVGIPTYNRVGVLPRAVESVRRQSLANLEIIIADNASPDETAAYCKGLFAADPRVRVIRHRHNIGAMANFRAVLDAASAPFFMWLCDDDWMSERYLERCVSVLERCADCSIAFGRAKYFRGDRLSRTSGVSLAQVDAGSRIAGFFSHVVYVDELFGVMRTAQAREVFSTSGLAADQLFLARMLLLGKSMAVDDVWTERSLAGASSTLEGAVRDFEAPAFLARSLTVYWSAIAWNVFRDIQWNGAVYRRLGWRRLPLALAAAAIIARRFVWRVLWREVRRHARVRTRLKSAWAWIRGRRVGDAPSSVGQPKLPDSTKEERRQA